ncbi:MAG: lipoate--protein ligase family protein [Bacillota bacterium]
MSGLEFRLLKTGHSSGAMNMALDEAILDHVKEGKVAPTIRFYGWQPATVTLGYFQKLTQELDVTACQEWNVDIVRRLTGGRAVLHDDELTYSLIISEEDSLLPKSVIESYKVISQGLLAGLEELGVAAKLVSRAEKKQRKSQSAACFDAPSWYELTVDGKKIIGSAQTRRRGVLLQHGSIINSQNLDKLFSILKFTSDRKKERFKKLFIKKATTLHEVCESSFTFKELVAAFESGFQQGLDITLTAGELTASELELAQELAAEKYNSRDWNYKR